MGHQPNRISAASTLRRHRAVVGVLGLLCVVAGFYLLANVWFSRNVHRQLKATHEAMSASSFSCDQEATEKTQRWSKLGWARYCERDGQKDGLWQAWEAQHLSIEGRYRDGQQHGRWVWFRPDGTLQRVIEYRNGEEVSDRIVSDEPGTG